MATSPARKLHADRAYDAIKSSQQTGAYPANEAAPLGIHVSGKTAGLAVEIIGLPRGTAISSGRPLGPGAGLAAPATPGD